MYSSSSLINFIGIIGNWSSHLSLKGRGFYRNQVLLRDYSALCQRVLFWLTYTLKVRYFFATEVIVIIPPFLEVDGVEALNFGFGSFFFDSLVSVAYSLLMRVYIYYFVVACYDLMEHFFGLSFLLWRTTHILIILFIGGFRVWCCLTTI